MLAEGVEQQLRLGAAGGFVPPGADAGGDVDEAVRRVAVSDQAALPASGPHPDAGQRKNPSGGGLVAQLAQQIVKLDLRFQVGRILDYQVGHGWASRLQSPLCRVAHAR